MHGEMLTYGLKKNTTNELLHIDDVSNGKSCGCECPYCHHDLIARNGGKKKEHHFAHASGADCGKARMTALHILAQNVLKREKKVMLPEYRGKYYQETARQVEFDDVELEKTYVIEDKKLRPDCVGVLYDKNLKTHELWVEIFVTNDIKEQKQEYIKQSGNACIEITFSDLLNTTYNEDSVKERLLDSSYGHWVYSPKFDRLEAAGRAKAEEARIERVRLEAERRALEIKMAREEQERMKYYKLLISTWKESADTNATDTIIKEIRKRPYLEEDEEDTLIKDILVPQRSWAQAFQTFPRNEDGLRVFYCLLRYYYKSIRLDDRSHKRWKVIDTPMWNLINQKARTIEDNVYLEYLIVLWATNLLNNHRRYSDSDSELPKLFAHNEKIRKGLMEIMLQGGDRSRFHEKNVRESIKERFKDREDGENIIRVFEVCFPFKTPKKIRHEEQVNIPEPKVINLDPYGFEKEWGRIHSISLKEACELTNKAFEEQEQNKNKTI